MKALVYHGPGKPAWEDKPRPTIQHVGDAIVRITTSTICGTDLHILKGDLPAVTDGRILGHEGIGIVEDVGSGVSEFHVGDKVIISCVTACLKCDFCRRGTYSHCRQGGWILGYTIDGTQAEYVRIPYADGSLYRFPHGGDEESLVMVCDILATGFECGVLNGQVKPGDTVAIVGAECRRPRWLHSATFDICQSIIAAGGHIANVGVHGKPVELHMEKLWDRNISLTTRLVDTVTIPMLLKMVSLGKLQPRKLVTHRFAMGHIMAAYETFGNAAKEGALKVILTNGEPA